MPEYLPLGALRQELLPRDCRSCAWWFTTGGSEQRGPSAAGKRRAWLNDLEHEWGYVGLLVHEPALRRAGPAPADPVISASIHFAPGSSLARFRELPFPQLPASSALLFCFHSDEDAPRWMAKRLIRRSLYELRARGIAEVFAVARWTSGNDDDCRFFSAALLVANGFEQVSGEGGLCLMRVDNRSLIALVGQVEMAVRRMFSHDHEPAPSPSCTMTARSTRSRSAGDRRPARFVSRVLPTVRSWSAMAFTGRPDRVTKASPGYTRSTVVVNGTT